MAKKDSRNLNVTINNKANDDDRDIVISISGVFRMLKKYFLPWLIISAMAFVAIGGFSTFRAVTKKPALSALISFNYDGIEKGKDPSGRNFDVNMVKNSQVIADAMYKQDLDMEKAAVIQENITFEGIIPSDAIDKITAYKSVYENASSGNLAAAQAMLDVAFHPTQFKVFFDYNDASLSRKEAVQLFDNILEGFGDYFYDHYGYNKNLGVSITSIDYSDYDYSEAVDVFKSNLSTLTKYVRGLADADTKQFRSSQTGRTFNDLAQAAKTISSIDLDRISSKIAINNITKNKADTIAYYEFRIDELNREKDAYTERLANVTNSIKDYQKDSLLIMSTTEGTNAELSKNSGEYDKLVERKESIAADLAETKQSINYYIQRKEKLEKAVTSTEQMQKEVEEDLAKVSQKLDKLVQDTETTADEYYRIVEFAHAYNV
ncbi:MAG: lipopolysaccharide biosynthesis protein, partial [Ruminococcus sp.]|nr:lipopolysaccharide biosynthesis protein [Ruminococcus sp.]